MLVTASVATASEFFLHGFCLSERRAARRRALFADDELQPPTPSLDGADGSAEHRVFLRFSWLRFHHGLQCTPQIHPPGGADRFIPTTSAVNLVWHFEHSAFHVYHDILDNGFVDQLI